MAFSSSTNHWIHDVFFSFRGEDTRYGFVDILNAALKRRGVLTFIDDKLPRGREIKPELVRAIKGSRISIVVFSINYGSSRWCLDELVEIMECGKTYGQEVLPLFFNVNPSNVRHQTGAFGEQFEALEGTPEMLRKWKSALTEAANISGWDARNRIEDEVLEEVAEDIMGKLDGDSLSITEFPVGLKSRAQEMIKLIQDESSQKGCVVGIWGMRGLGKTTVAKVIYNEIRRRFMHRCFIDNIREVDVNNSKECIDFQEKLLSGLGINTRDKIYSVAMGTSMIEKSLVGKGALIVLDDVTNFEQLKTLCGNIGKLLLESVIIITTHNERVLRILQGLKYTVHICRLKKMDKNESLELFSWHAFRQECPRLELSKNSMDVVAYCGGLPLALEVLGSYLFEKTKEEWECVLNKLKKIPNDQVHEKLKISYDGLDSDQQKIFLDICCFFIGKNRADVTEILKGCDLHPVDGITTLVERCLIKIGKKNKLNMHDLVRDMGREIVRRSSKDEPEKRNRLWLHKEVVDVLSDETGTNAIEGLTLKLQKNSVLHFNTKTFEKMKKLRLLQLDYVQLDGDYKYLNRNLRWVCWQGFPLKHIPDNLYQEEVISIELKYSNIRQVWKEQKWLKNLKILNLSHSRNLIRTPDFSTLPNLSKLILKDCPSLTEVHQSIGDLTNLLLINLMDCTNLSNLPSTIYKSKSVHTFILSGCSKIDRLEEGIGEMESLTTLIAKDAGIKEIPRSIVRLKSIGYISLCGYEGLANDIFPALVLSWASPKANLESSTQPFKGTKSSIISMNIRDKNCRDLLPMIHDRLSEFRCILVQCYSESQLSLELARIMDALLSDVKFTELEKTSYPSQVLENAMKSFLMIGNESCHQVINMLYKTVSKELGANDSSDASLPGDKYPYWQAYVGQGHSARFQWPEDSDFCLKGMALCVVYPSTYKNKEAECLTGVLIVNYTKYTIQIFKQDAITSFNDEDWQGIISNLRPSDDVQICVAFGHGLTVLKTAIYLIYDQPIAAKKEESPKVNMLRSEEPLSTSQVEGQPSGGDDNPCADVQKKKIRLKRRITK